MADRDLLDEDESVEDESDAADRRPLAGLGLSLFALVVMLLLPEDDEVAHAP